MKKIKRIKTKSNLESHSKLIIFLSIFFVSCSSNTLSVKVYDFDQSRCSQSKHVSLSKSKDSLDCFRYVKKITGYNKSIIINDSYYLKGVGYTFSVKKSFLFLDSKTNDTIAIIDYDGGKQILINSRNKSEKKLLNEKGKSFYSSLY